MKKRFMSILLTLCMVLSMLLMTAHAADNPLDDPNTWLSREGWEYVIKDSESNRQQGGAPYYQWKNGKQEGKNPLGIIPIGTPVDVLGGDGYLIVRWNNTLYHVWDPRTIAAYKLDDGWHTMGVFDRTLNIDDSGNAELNHWLPRPYGTFPNFRGEFYIENRGSTPLRGQITMRLTSGKYLGISGSIENGTRVTEVDSPYLWYVYKENNHNEIYSLRPHANTEMVLNASGWGKDIGTHVVLWTDKNKDWDAPGNADWEFRALKGNHIPKVTFKSEKIPAPTPKPTSASTGAVTAVPTNTKFMLKGAEAALPAYSIGGNNYVKLRDVGALLKTRFDVRWENGKAKLYNHAAYTKTSGELATIGKDSKSAALSATDFVWGDTGAAVKGLTAYTIGGNNFIKLRDIAKLFNFDVDWRDGKAWIEPDVSPYTED